MMKVIVGVSPALKKNSEENSLARLDALRPGRETRGLFRRNSSLVQVVPEDIEWEKISIEEIIAMATTLSLMGDVRVFRLEGALNSSRADEFLDAAQVFAASPHHFIFTEEKLLKRPTDLVTKAGANVVVYASSKKDQPAQAGAGFNMFSITTTFAARDRKKLWLELHQALRSGVVPEAFAGMLHWKVRDMISKPGFSKSYSKIQLHRISRELTTLYHDSHRGGGDLALLLERFILQL